MMTNKPLKPLRLIIAASAIAVLLGGCGARDQAQAPVQPAPAVTGTQQPVKPSAEAPSDAQKQQQPKTAEIQTYFGDENGDNLVAKQVTISYNTDKDKYIAALKALQKSPDGKLISLFDDWKFNTVSADQDKLRLDVSIGDDGKLGSNGESLDLQALKKTVFQFPEINEIYVTVDGKQTESLMGHMDLPYPIKRK